MPNGDPWVGYFYPTLTLMIDSYILLSEKWIVLVNQAHPKINGRIRMGVDVAKQRMIRGEPFILKVKQGSPCH